MQLLANEAEQVSLSHRPKILLHTTKAYVMQEHNPSKIIFRADVTQPQSYTFANARPTNFHVSEERVYGIESSWNGCVASLQIKREMQDVYKTQELSQYLLFTAVPYPALSSPSTSPAQGWARSALGSRTVFPVFSLAANENEYMFSPSSFPANIASTHQWLWDRGSQVLCTQAWAQEEVMLFWHLSPFFNSSS